MREFRTSGSVGARGGNLPGHLASVLENGCRFELDSIDSAPRTVSLRTLGPAQGSGSLTSSSKRPPSSNTLPRRRSSCRRAPPAGFVLTCSKHRDSEGAVKLPKPT